MLRFASLASGSGGNCIIVETSASVGGSRVLIDCGLKLTETERRLERLGVAPGAITGILVTHEHGDHACGVFDYAAAHNVTVYLTYGTLRAMREEGKVTDGVRVVVVDGRQSFAVADVQVHPFTVPHDSREPVQYVVSDGASRLGVLTDIGTPTAHVAACLAGCDALVLECNHDLDMLWAGAYPKWLKQRIAGPFGHLHNGDSERLLAMLDRSRLKHVIAAHLSQQNNRPDLARAALARAMGCEPGWIGLATQDEGFAWREA